METGSEIATQVEITEGMLDSERRAELLAVTRRAVAATLVNYLVDHGRKAVSVRAAAEYDGDLKTWDVTTWASTVRDPRLIALVGVMAKHQRDAFVALTNVNSLPWWRFLWLKLRGRPIVKVD